MKKIYLFYLFIFFIFYTQSQNINFTDSAFKTALLAHVPNIDTNFDGEIDTVEAASVFELNISDKSINSIDGIENFVNLNSLDCSLNYLTNLNGIQFLPNLFSLDCSSNGLSNIDEISNMVTLDNLNCSSNFNISNINVTQLTQLTVLNCSFTSISSLDVSQNTLLWELNCLNCFLTTIDIMNNHQLTKLVVQDNQLETMFIKNGNETLISGGDLYFAGNPNLEYICVDDFGVDSVALQWAISNNVSPYTYLDRVNSYCTFGPGGGNYVINGQNKYDADSNGCDISDPSLPFLSFNIDNGTSSGSFISNSTGNYSIAVPQGTYTITPDLNAYFTASPSSIVVDFSTAPNPSTQDFCITPNGVFNDLEITILPLEIARPGFDVAYSIQYRNKGTTILSGDFNLIFDDNYLDYISSSPAATNINVGELGWSFNNLEPFETREVLFTMNANTPTDPTYPLNSGDILNFTTTISSSTSDETPEDNTFELSQTVVNSYDPNDKRCLEGDQILPSEVGEYVTYLIRFENNGTASAVNIVVKDVIDMARFDISSLEVLNASHDYVAKIRDTNIVEFIFENINLPFDDANNDGYVLFKIKTLPTLVENDTFENKAEIYFDYNPAIITNTAQTTVMSVLNISDYELDGTISFYPNPVSELLYIKGENTLKSILIYDINGRVLFSKKLNNTQQEVSLSTLKKGFYFIRVNSNKGQIINKIIKH